MVSEITGQVAVTYTDKPGDCLYRTPVVACRIECHPTHVGRFQLRIQRTIAPSSTTKQRELVARRIFTDAT